MRLKRAKPQVDRIISTSFLMLTELQPRRTYEIRRLAVSIGFACVLALALYLLSTSFEFVGVLLVFALGVSNPIDLFERYRTYKSDWEFANSTEPVLEVHREAKLLVDSGFGEKAIELLKRTFAGQNGSSILLVDAYRRIGGDDAHAELVKLMKRSPDDRIRSMAVNALGSEGFERRVSPLVEALNDSDRCVRVAAIDALAEIGTVEARSALMVAEPSMGKSEQRRIRRFLENRSDSGLVEYQGS